MLRWLPAILVLLAAPVAPANAVADGPCFPSNFRLGGGSPPMASSATRFDTTRTGSDATVRVAWDLGAGTVDLSRTSGVDDTVGVYAADRITLIGLPHGTLVTVTQVLDVNAWVGATACPAPDGFFCATVAAVNADDFVFVDPQANAPKGGGTATLAGSFPISYQLQAGIPQSIVYGLTIAGGFGVAHEGAGHASIRFEGLPPGASIVSCGGYSTTPTAARGVTWGALKLRYR